MSTSTKAKDFDKKSLTAFLLNNEFPTETPEEFFQAMSLDIKSDKYLVKLAMHKLHVNCHQFSSNDRQNDRDLILFGLHLDTNFLVLVDDKIKLHHKEFIEYLLHNFQIYEHLPPKLQEESEFVVLAAKTYSQFSTLPVSLYNDKKLILECLKYDAGIFEHISEDLKDDPEIAKALIDLDPLLLFSCGEKCQTDRDLMIYACERNGAMLEGAIPEFQEDRDICFAAIGQFGACLKYCSEKWKSDKKLVMLSLEKHSHAIQFASEEIRRDPDVAKLALANDMFSPQEGAFVAFEFLFHFSNDKEMVTFAIQQNPASFKYASKDLQSKKELVMLAVSQEGCLLEFASESCKDDIEIVTTAIQNNGLSIRFASPDVQQDRQIVSVALRQNGNALEFVDCKGDEEMCKIAVQSRGESIKFVQNPTLEIFKLALEENGEAYFEIGECDIKTRETTMLAIRNGANLELGTEDSDLEFYLEIAKRSGMPFSFFENEEVFANKEIMFYAIKTNPNLLFKLRGNLMYDEDLIWDSLELDHSLSAIPREMQENPKLLSKALKNATNFLWISEEKRKDEKFILSVLDETKNDEIISYIHVSLIFKFDFALKAISICPNTYLHFPKKIQVDKEIAQTALSLNGHLLKNAPQKIQNDIQMVSIAFKKSPSCIMTSTTEIRNKFLSELLEDVNGYSTNEESMKILIQADPEFFSYCDLILKRNVNFLQDIVCRQNVELDSQSMPFLSKKALMTLIQRKQENIYLDLVQTNFLKDREIIMNVIQNKLDLLNYTDVLRFYKNDKEIMFQVLLWICRTMKEKEILIKFIRNHESASIFGKSSFDWIPLVYQSKINKN